jgi:serine/threonine protein kinase
MAQSLVGRDLGRYRVMAELGRGQHSTVYKAWQPSLERYVALKVLQRYDQETLAKFQAEARLTAQLIQLGVPSIRQVYEVGQATDGYLYVALEYVDDSLRSLLARAQHQNRRLRPEAAVRLLDPIAAALDAIHRLGWVHLDIKPENILITGDGRAVLADFGIAQRRGAQTHACTPAYASPEQAAGDRPVGPWSDIYSLGAVLYEMVTGHPPVRGDQDIVLLTQHLEVKPPSPRRVNSDLTAGQERAIYRALAKAPSERFQTAGELIDALLASGGTSRASSIQTPDKGSMPAVSRGRRNLGAGLILVAALLLAMALYLTGRMMWAGQSVGIPTATTAVSSLPSRTTGPPLVATTVRPTRPVVSPTAVKPPTATLAPTLTWTPRPTATPPPVSSPPVSSPQVSSPQPTESGTPGP